MCIARLPTTRASVATRCQHCGEGPQVNKFEQVSSLDHQMSLAVRSMCMVGLGGSHVCGGPV